MWKFFKSKKFIIPFVLVLILGAFFFFRNRNQPTVKKTADTTAFNPKKDEIVKPQTKDLRETLTLSGSIDAASKADVRFQTSGRLAWVGIKLGDRVRKYQSIASLDKTELRKSLEKEFNDYQSQLSQFEDTSDEYKHTDTITDEIKRIKLRSQTALDNAVIAYELTDLSIKYASIYSPINGILVAADQLSPGINITPASASFTIIDPSTVFFKAEIDQEDVPKIKEGMTATIELDSFSDEPIESTITQISFVPISGRTSVVYEVRLALPSANQDLKYRLGMDGDAILNLAQVTNTLTIPFDALVEEGDKDYVYIKDPSSNIIVKKEVKVGIETIDDIEILEGITENDQIVIKN